MSRKGYEEPTRHNAQASTDYSEISDVQPSLTGLGTSGNVQQHVIASPRTSKKRSFLHALSKGSQRKGTIITRPINHDGVLEESHEVS